MQARTMILAVLVGGPLAGVLLGTAANPTMIAKPEPSWHQARPEASFTRSQYLVDSGPQELSPYGAEDRTPTWKRREAARRAALLEAAYRDDFPEPYFTGEAPSEPAPPPVQLAPVQLSLGAQAAAADASPARDAQTAVIVAVPAATEQDEPAAAEAGG